MKLSYQKHWGECGTVYTQRIKMTEDIFVQLRDAVQAEIALNYPRKEKYTQTSGYQFFLEPLKTNGYSLCYLNHTQTRFVNLFLKLPLKDRNTYIKITK